MPRSATALRNLLAVLGVLAALAVVGELAVAALSGIRPTGFYALPMFAGFCGLAACRPAPSRMSDEPLLPMQRVMVAVVTTLLVALAALAFFRYGQGSNKLQVVWFSGLAYLLLLVVGSARWRTS